MSETIKTHSQVTTKTKSKVTTMQKVVLGVIMASTAALGLGFAGVYAKALKVKKSPPKILVPSAQPLNISRIDDASANLLVYNLGYYSEVSADFEIGQPQDEFSTTNLGYLSLSRNDYHSTDVQSPHPHDALKLTLSHGSEETQIVPARMIHITNNLQESYMLCIPETEVKAVDYADPYLGVSYYFDINGNPYTDSLLSKKAIAGDCRDILARSLDVSDIYDAKANLLVINNPNNPYSGPQLDFMDDFYGEYETFSIGYLGLSTNNYNRDNYFVPNNIKSPLVLQLSSWGDESYTAPSRLIHIAGVTSTEPGHTLCLPDTYLQGSPNNPGAYAPINYFYDINGNPYVDSLLSKRAMAGDCRDILARSLDVSDIYEANVNLPADNPNNPYSDPQVDFMDDFYGEYETFSIGYMGLSSGEYVRDNYFVPNNIKSPLVLQLSNMLDESYTAPSRLIHIAGVTSTEPGHTLCVPDTYLRTYLEGNPAPTNYFYDVDGTPYRDSFLSQKAMHGTCADILARSLDVSDIVSASVDRVVEIQDASYLEASFRNDFVEELGFETMGFLNLINNEYQDDNSLVPNTIKSPLALSLFYDIYMDEAPLVPYRNISINTNAGRSVSLCLPPTRFPEGEYGVTYFYNNEGKPFKDSFLTRSVTCPPVKPIEEIQYQELLQ